MSEEPSKGWERQSWKWFLDSGLLYFVNVTLHIFGVAIVVVEDDSGDILDAYPAKSHGITGFDRGVELKAKRSLSRFMTREGFRVSRNIDTIMTEEGIDDD